MVGSNLDSFSRQKYKPYLPIQKKLLNSKHNFKYMLWNEKVLKRVSVVQSQRHDILKSYNCNAVQFWSVLSRGSWMSGLKSWGTRNAERFRSHCSVQCCNCQHVRTQLSNTSHHTLWLFLENLAGLWPWFLESILQFLGVYRLCHPWWAPWMMPCFFLIKSLRVSPRDLPMWEPGYVKKLYKGVRRLGYLASFQAQEREGSWRLSSISCCMTESAIPRTWHLEPNLCTTNIRKNPWLVTNINVPESSLS